MSAAETRHMYCPICATPLSKQQVNGENRRACANPSCDYVEWNNPTPVLAAIAQTGNNVVLVQAIGWPKDWFGLVTGFHEAGETAEEGVVREIKEELGLGCQVESLVGVYSFFQLNQVIIAYHVLLDKGDITLDKQNWLTTKKYPSRNSNPGPAAPGKLSKTG